MRRREFIEKTAAVTAAAMAPFLTTSGCTQQDRPNILWIVSEDNSPLLGCYGDNFATTPNLDKFASESVLYENAFANTAVCAPARSTLITGMYACSTGTQNMRSRNPIPEFIKFYPDYLRDAGYYCSNRSKTDFNIAGDDKRHWDACDRQADYQNRQPGQPFFAIFNLGISHEGQLHKAAKSLRHDPEKVTLPPYHPDTPEIRRDWAHYYDKVEEMDTQVGAILQRLGQSAEVENTIVFYYSDHGGVLARSKRYIYETGTHVPLIIRFPKKYQHLAPGKAGSRIKRLVSFVDFAPTLLSLARISVPAHMQGNAFLGKQKTVAPRYAFFFRNRMDERIDMMRAARDERFRYIRNYYPHRIYGQHLNYLWKAPNTRSWEAAFKAGRCNAVQSIFWGKKPAEELYDTQNDPWEVKNLAADPAFENVLLRMRTATDKWCREIGDAGFLVEGEMLERTRETTAFELIRSGEISLSTIIDAANLASAAGPEEIPALLEFLRNEDSFVRYWAAVGLLKLGQSAQPALHALRRALLDSCADVRIIAAEALCAFGEIDTALAVLQKELAGPNLKIMLAALNALEYIGEPARQLLPEIRTVLENFDDEYTSRASEHLIAKFS